MKKMAISQKENALRFNDSSWGDVDDYMKFSGGDLVERDWEALVAPSPSLDFDRKSQKINENAC